MRGLAETYEYNNERQYSEKQTSLDDANHHISMKQEKHV